MRMMCVCVLMMMCVCVLMMCVCHAGRRCRRVVSQEALVVAVYRLMVLVVGLQRSGMGTLALSILREETSPSTIFQSVFPLAHAAHPHTRDTHTHSHFRLVHVHILLPQACKHVCLCLLVSLIFCLCACACVVSRLRHFCVTFHVVRENGSGDDEVTPLKPAAHMQSSAVASFMASLLKIGHGDRPSFSGSRKGSVVEMAGTHVMPPPLPPNVATTAPEPDTPTSPSEVRTSTGVMSMLSSHSISC